MKEDFRKCKPPGGDRPRSVPQQEREQQDNRAQQGQQQPGQQRRIRPQDDLSGSATTRAADGQQLYEQQRRAGALNRLSSSAIAQAAEATTAAVTNAEEEEDYDPESLLTSHAAAAGSTAAQLSFAASAAVLAEAQHTPPTVSERVSELMRTTSEITKHHPQIQFEDHSFYESRIEQGATESNQRAAEYQQELETGQLTAESARHVLEENGQLREENQLLRRFLVHWDCLLMCYFERASKASLQGKQIKSHEDQIKSYEDQIKSCEDKQKLYSKEKRMIIKELVKEVKTKKKDIEAKNKEIGELQGKVKELQKQILQSGARTTRTEQRYANTSTVPRPTNSFGQASSAFFQGPTPRSLPFRNSHTEQDQKRKRSVSPLVSDSVNPSTSSTKRSRFSSTASGNPIYRANHSALRPSVNGKSTAQLSGQQTKKSRDGTAQKAPEDGFSTNPNIPQNNPGTGALITHHSAHASGTGVSDYGQSKPFPNRRPRCLPCSIQNCFLRCNSVMPCNKCVNEGRDCRYLECTGPCDNPDCTGVHKDDEPYLLWKDE